MTKNLKVEDLIRKTSDLIERSLRIAGQFDLPKDIILNLTNILLELIDIEKLPKSQPELKTTALAHINYELDITVGELYTWIEQTLEC